MTWACICYRLHYFFTSLNFTHLNDIGVVLCTLFYLKGLSSYSVRIQLVYYLVTSVIKLFLNHKIRTILQYIYTHTPSYIDIHHESSRHTHALFCHRRHYRIIKYDKYSTHVQILKKKACHLFWQVNPTAASVAVSSVLASPCCGQR